MIFYTLWPADTIWCHRSWSTLVQVKVCSKPFDGTKPSEPLFTSHQLSFVAFIPWKQLNTLRPRQNGCHFTDDTFQRIYLNKNVWFPIKISLRFVPKGPINNIPALVQIMAWRCPGDKPLYEPMMVSLLMHICVTRPQWVNKKCSRYQFMKWV